MSTTTTDPRDVTHPSGDVGKLCERLRAVDHTSMEDCFFQSPLLDRAASTLESLAARAEAAEAANAAVTAERDRMVEALRRCLNFIENTEGEHNVEFECGDLARAALANVKTVASDPICRQCASGEPGIPEECTCESAAVAKVSATGEPL